MENHNLAGKPAPRDILVDVPRLITAYYTYRPDPAEPTHRVHFGTSGHRGSSLKGSFNEAHILAITQAICEHRVSQDHIGPLYVGVDTHALSAPALSTVLEVLAANGMETVIQQGRLATPTPVISHAILAHNRGRGGRLADGIVITPSHNPPQDGGLKYNPPDGGPADPLTTKAIQDRANEIMARDLREVRRIPLERALRASTTHEHDYIGPYVEDLEGVIDMEIIAGASLRLGVDPLGGSTLPLWAPIAERYGLNIDVVNQVVNPTFSFMTVDWDGQIRMDCSSPYAMASLIKLKDRFDIAFGNDPDGDRHGIVTATEGLMNPNHYLAVAVWYLFQNRPRWSRDAAVGKTLVSSAMIDRVTAHLGRQLFEVPVGFKWFVEGLMRGTLGFGGEESAGASFLRQDGTVWTTDKDGIILDLLAAEITARLQRDPSEVYRELEAQFGSPVYRRQDVAATPAQKAALAKLNPDHIQANRLAGERITIKLAHVPGTDAPIGGVKVIAPSGWFAIRPSGTEDIYKIYAESFRGEEHLVQILEEAQAMASSVM